MSNAGWPGWRLARLRGAAQQPLALFGDGVGDCACVPVPPMGTFEPVVLLVPFVSSFMMLGVPSPDPTVDPVLPLADVPHGVCRAPVCGEPLDDAPLCGPAAGLVDWPGVGAGVGPVPVVLVFGGIVTD